MAAQRQQTISLFAWLSNATTRDEPIKGGAKTVAQLLNQGANLRGTDSAHKSLVFHLLQLEPKYWNTVSTYCEAQPSKHQLLNDVVVASLRQTTDMFHVAAARGKATTLQKVLDEVRKLPCHVDIQRALNEFAPIPHNGTPMMIAARHGKDTLLRVLLDCTENPNPMYVRDAFMLAATAAGPGAKPRECMAMCCDWLVRNHHDHLNIDQLWPVRVFPRDSPALLYASELAPPGWIDTEKHNSILHFACLQGDTHAVTTCLARPDAAKLVVAANLKGQTPLHYALSFGFSDCVKALLEAGADPSTVDSYANTPLNQAVYVINTTGGTAAHEQALLVFSRFNDQTRTLTRDTLMSSLMLYGRELMRDAAIIALLQATGWPTDVLAQVAGSEAGAHLLPLVLQRGLLDRSAMTPNLLWVCIQAQWPIDRLRSFLSLVDIKQPRDSDQETLLALCVQNVQLASTVKILLDLGADANTRLKDGRTPLHSAVIAANVEAVRHLVRAGANRTAKDNSHKIPADYLPPPSAAGVAASAVPSTSIASGSSPTSGSRLSAGQPPAAAWAAIQIFLTAPINTIPPAAIIPAVSSPTTPSGRTLVPPAALSSSPGSAGSTLGTRPLLSSSAPNPAILLPPKRPPLTQQRPQQPITFAGASAVPILPLPARTSALSSALSMNQGKRPAHVTAAVTPPQQPLLSPRAIGTDLGDASSSEVPHSGSPTLLSASSPHHGAISPLGSLVVPQVIPPLSNNQFSLSSSLNAPPALDAYRGSGLAKVDMDESPEDSSDVLLLVPGSILLDDDDDDEDDDGDNDDYGGYNNDTYDGGDDPSHPPLRPTYAAAAAGLGSTGGRRSRSHSMRSIDDGEGNSFSSTHNTSSPIAIGGAAGSRSLFMTTTTIARSPLLTDSDPVVRDLLTTASAYSPASPSSFSAMYERSGSMFAPRSLPSLDTSSVQAAAAFAGRQGIVASHSIAVGSGRPATAATSAAALGVAPAPFAASSIQSGWPSLLPALFPSVPATTAPTAVAATAAAAAAAAVTPF